MTFLTALTVLSAHSSWRTRRAIEQQTRELKAPETRQRTCGEVFAQQKYEREMQDLQSRIQACMRANGELPEPPPLVDQEEDTGGI